MLNAPPASAEGSAEREAPRTYKSAMPRGWWLRRRHYFLYMLREFTALPLALWLIWLLFEIHRAGSAQTYYPAASPAFIVFSIVCLAAALYHSITFLSLAGVIIHVKGVSSRLVVLSQFALWFGASVIIGAILVLLSR
jgi:succinate dehydrogenase subunit C